MQTELTSTLYNATYLPLWIGIFLTFESRIRRFWISGYLFGNVDNEFNELIISSYNWFAASLEILLTKATQSMMLEYALWVIMME